MVREINTQRRWTILRRDLFRCAYCKASPGNERLNIDHMVSIAYGGSDHDNNLITTCDRCNNGKRELVSIPIEMCEGKDRDGWITWKRWGDWSLKWNPDATLDSGAVIAVSIGEGLQEYWFELDRIHEDWYDHLSQKVWVKGKVLSDLCNLLDFAETLIERVGE